jgi:hypothetical protein
VSSTIDDRDGTPMGEPSLEEPQSRPAEATEEPMLSPDFQRQQKRKQRTRRVRRTAGGGTLAVLISALIWVKVGGDNPLPAGLPLIGRDANDVYNDIRQAGYPVAPGRPQQKRFNEILKNNSCRSSKGFVRTDKDVGWAIICVKPPRDAYRRMSKAFDSVPVLVGPLFVDDNGGDVLIFGFGWPLDSSKKIYQAIGASGGSYLSEKSG